MWNITIIIVKVILINDFFSCHFISKIVPNRAKRTAGHLRVIRIVTRNSLKTRRARPLKTKPDATIITYILTENGDFLSSVKA